MSDTPYIADLWQGLKKGDSGSWVIDPLTGVLYGHVIAIAKGYAFIRPTKDVFEEIKDIIKFNVVQMPTPFDLLAELSKLDSRQFVPTQAAEFAKQSIANNTLHHSTQSASAKIIQGVLLGQSTLEKAVLCRIIQTTGSDVIGALQDSKIWDSARDGRFGEKESAVQVLKSLSREARLPQVPLAMLKPKVIESGGPSGESGKSFP